MALPEWFYPGPPGGWTADMLDHLPPGTPRHVELIDGALMVTLLTDRDQGIQPPSHLAVAREMSITLGPRQRPEPDVLVLRREALSDLRRTWYRPEEVHLVVEVVSPESAERDRLTKPIKYSNAGIRYLWRVEQEDQHAVAYTFELEPSVKAYVPTGIHRKRLVTYAGFDVDIDLDLSQFMG
ncbi:Uma2 family endonuclease [Microbispora sp. H10670]|uniref:Uma2 family endonuclease n=1 Tax=Microbispora sp. H10670 TaxID=2729108 RepID=UPI0016013ADE|nr:Uma2 family endonuclease [Microbispora sp. H10670]